MPKNPDDLIVPAREGTLNVMRAASRASVQRVVQTSSLSAIFHGRDDPNSHLFTEADWTDPDHKDNVPYTRSKTIAERAAWAELPNLPRPLEWVAINPGMVLGPVLDKDSSASVQLVAKLLKGEIPGLPRFGYPIVDVRDLADLEVRAMTAPQAAGQRYIGSGPFIPLSEIANVLKERLGDRARRCPPANCPTGSSGWWGFSIARSAASYSNSARYGDRLAQRRRRILAGHLDPGKTRSWTQRPAWRP
jgi:dihydroflavonol-4-reductase